MNANASKSPTSDTALMAPVAEKVTEAVITIMQYFGIQNLEVRKVKSAEYERIIAASDNFPGIPEDLITCGFLIKDAIAKIMASVGVIKIELTYTDEELKALKDSYASLIKYRDRTVITAAASSCEQINDVPVKKCAVKTKKCSKKSCRVKK